MHSYRLTKSDYQKILMYYHQPVPKSKHLIKKRAENIISRKLCSCIKQVARQSKSNGAVGICTNSVIKRKGLRRGTFKCKKNSFVQLSKTRRRI